MLFSRLLLIICCFYGLNSFSQAIDTTTQTKDTAIYYINHASTGIVNRTNTSNSFLFNNNLKFNITKMKVAMNSTHNWAYGEQQSKVTNNDFSSTVDFNLLKKVQKIYYWGLLTFDKSYSLKIDKRVQAGVGIAYNIVNRDNLIFVVSDGILYENSDLYDKLPYQIARNSFRIKFKYAITNFLSIDGSDFLQHALGDAEDYILKSNTNMGIKIRKWLSFTTSVNYNKLNLTQNENFLLTFGFAVDTYL